LCGCYSCELFTFELSAKFNLSSYCVTKLGKQQHSEYISPFHLSNFLGFQNSLENTHKGYTLCILLGDQGLNSFQLHGLPTHQGFCPWILLGALPPDRLTLCAHHIFCSVLLPLKFYFYHCQQPDPTGNQCRSTQPVYITEIHS